jgi:hypothetical protein
MEGTACGGVAGPRRRTARRTHAYLCCSPSTRRADIEQRRPMPESGACPCCSPGARARRALAWPTRDGEARRTRARLPFLVLPSTSGKRTRPAQVTERGDTALVHACAGLSACSLQRGRRAAPVRKRTLVPGAPRPETPPARAVPQRRRDRGRNGTWPESRGRKVSAREDCLSTRAGSGRRQPGPCLATRPPAANLATSRPATSRPADQPLATSRR